MVRDIIEKNGRVNPNADLLKKLKSLIPGVIAKDGSIDADAIRYWAECAVGDPKLVTEERETFNFLGKDYARLLYALDTETVITPDEENNRKSENKNSENLYLSGDNLEVLKHLRHSYEGQVKCIYIDPPYNTGSDDFVYNDSFDFTEKDLKEKLGLDDDAQVEKIMNMRKRGSRSHAAWLTFMYPRLKLARDLLKDDGVIFISIDDNEQANLKILCDEIFGEENFVADMIWESKYTVSNDSQYVSSQHEYVLFYARKIESFKIGRLERTEEQNASYKNRDNDPKGPWKATPLHAKSGTEKSKYDITFSNGITWKCPQGRFPRYSKDTLLKLYEQNELYFNKNGGVDKKTYLSEVSEKGVVPGSILKYSDVGHTHENNEELASVIGKGMFDNPKGTKLLSRVMNLANLQDSDIVLDFFSGSGTTAHAVMRQNAEENGNCKFIVVQISASCPEQSEAFKAGYKTIDQIGMERIRRAAAKIKEEHPDSKCDFGFKHYIIQKPAEKSLDSIKNFEPNPNFGEATILKQFGAETVLATWMVDDGHTFNANVEKIDLNGYTAYKVNDYLYLINSGIDGKHVKELFKKYDEDKNFKPKHIVLFGYSFGMTTLDTLKANIKNVDGIDIHLEIRY
ncbi:site-specific DNA-methyltransferase [Fibrobacter sp. UWB13]|uniref:site-specific DNA-methyltransferase n=1 Tax=Fibrobacter sp. UWB13 TaxID=1896204 RepID=UPI000A0ECC33|nr:site-specific DNA-methyltransferase [Fibrobacter sp. UWB13]SMG26327.1 type III restriction enzyme/adenine-specific DNA-methyltransferase [Fibrobacter sp. UWB13]